ncbi:DUF2892 domain-containing protein [Bacillus sp. M6-12]|uniref:YgaP family membrane protein n=1 Tax=Bacillus sp. M6-12 TaxID=2054166 RepID=UPI000C763981|nr:DUF2892 domain-containing protein [Bacillus sp. M6-12]PLS17019.1 DUF2892 domain-containing protein [Bacillus sp. M6-12]
MNGKQNIGTINALIRITCGFTLLSWATAKMVKKPWRGSALLIAMMAGMKVGEGILRYCPVTEMVKEGTSMMESEGKNNKRESSDSRQ